VDLRAHCSAYVAAHIRRKFCESGEASQIGVDWHGISFFPPVFSFIDWSSKDIKNIVASLYFLDCLFHFSVIFGTSATSFFDFPWDYFVQCAKKAQKRGRTCFLRAAGRGWIVLGDKVVVSMSNV